MTSSAKSLLVSVLLMVTPASPIHDELSWCIKAARAPRLRPMREFAEAELVMPEGKYQGRRYRVHRQPFQGLLLEEVDSGHYNRYAILGCVQSGKSWIAFIVPTCYHLFEHREKVINGVPTASETGADKWKDELLPVIQQSRYDVYLPTRGAGSRGGTATEYHFGNGAKLKYMSGTGGDEKRSNYTARVTISTEVDKMDRATGVSREADPTTQIEARTLSYDATEKQIWLECTVSIESGKIFVEYLASTQSRIVVQCPHCHEWSTPEREHLVGWQEAETALEAGRLAYFACPQCGQRWTDQQRRDLNRRAKLLHRGQQIDRRGTITGEPPETDTLGFRWNAFNNMFWSVAMIGSAEWKAVRADDEENAEREMSQFYWATPAKPATIDTTPLSTEAIMRRTDRYPKGLVPRDATCLTTGVDLGKRLAHYVVIAWRGGAGGHVCDYGVFEIESDRLGSQAATLIALREFRDVVLAGWTREGGEPMVPAQVWIDSGWWETKDAVYQFCKEKQSEGNRFQPTKGFGMLQQRDRTYRHPDKKTTSIRLIGDQYHVARVQKDRILLVHVNADHWKTQVHERLAMPIESAGALTVFHATPHEHTKFAKHMVSEKQVQEFIPGKGEVIVWKRESRNNHFFDAIYQATAAAHFAGVRLVRGDEPAAPIGAAPAATSWFAQQQKRTRRRA